MRRLHMIPALLVGALSLAGTHAFAQNATVVMRSGDRVQAEVLDMGAAFTFRINGQERQVPIDQVALIDFASNGRNLPRDEVAKANDASGNGFVVLRNGDTFTGRLDDVHGTPTKGMFLSGSGNRDIELGQVARIYVGSVNGIADLVQAPPPAASAPQAPSASTPPTRPPGSREVVVPSNFVWMDTGITVRKGQRFRFYPSGEIRLSSNADDRATPATSVSYRFSPRATIPGIPVGALIGRIGSGAAFPIGQGNDTFTMSANGKLFLGVNDDYVDDNVGNYIVYVSQQ